MKFKRIKIFKAGTHDNSKEQSQHTFSNEDVAKIYAATRTRPEALIPITLFHPHNDLPVLGRVPSSSLELVFENGDAVITAEPSEFAEKLLKPLRAAGLDKVSIGVRKDSSIKHIGLVPEPAVSGLGLAFSAQAAALTGDELLVSFSSDALDHPAHTFMEGAVANRFDSISQVLRRLREWVVGKEGIEAADRVISSYHLDYIGSAVSEDQAKAVLQSPLSFSETPTEQNMKPEEVAALVARAEAAERKLAEEQARTQAAVREALAASFAAELDKRIERISPKAKDAALALMVALAAANEAELTFSVGGKEVKKSAHQAFLEFVDALPLTFKKDEVATNATAGTQAESADPFAGGKSITEVIAEETRKKMKAA